jgi:hypothetical protein
MEKSHSINLRALIVIALVLSASARTVSEWKTRTIYQVRQE